MKQLFIYLLPIVFMLHEFEEIILMQTWLQKNKNYLHKRFPVIADKIDAFGKIESPAFALMVLEEFLIVSTCTILAMNSDILLPWYCCLLAFSMHFIIHIAQFLIMRKYIPVIVTSVLCFPYCVWALICASAYYTIEETLLWSMVSLMVCIANLLLLHRFVPELWKKISGRKQ